jgi:hypothetical protein
MVGSYEMGKQEYGSKRGWGSRFLRRMRLFPALALYITPLFLVLGSKFKSTG